MNTYKFPDDYNNFGVGLFSLCKLDNDINFVEVCNIGGDQVCIKRSARMNELFANDKGDFYFNGYCKELGQSRLFEFLMPEYDIDNRLQDSAQWLFSVTAKTKHMLDLECSRINSKLLWSGKSELVEFTDVYSEVKNGQVIQTCKKRIVHIKNIFVDSRNRIYIETIDPNTDEISISYPSDLKFSLGKRLLVFETWCKKVLKIDIWSLFPEE